MSEVKFQCLRCSEVYSSRPDDHVCRPTPAEVSEIKAQLASAHRHLASMNHINDQLTQKLAAVEADRDRMKKAALDVVSVYRRLYTDFSGDHEWQICLKQLDEALAQSKTEAGE